MTTVDKVNPRLKQRYRDEIAGKLQEQYGWERERAEQEVRDFERTLD